MPLVRALHHVAFENLGLLEPLLKARKFEIEHVSAPLTAWPLDLVGPDLVILLGGPIGVYETGAYPFLEPELAAIHARLARAKPTLGLCLGAQLIAAALGAEVKPGPVKEIGFAPVDVTADGMGSVLAPLSQGQPVLHWHGDVLDLPAGAKRLASTGPTPNQAFSLGASILGLQFHLEVRPGDLETWLVGHAVELAQAAIKPGDLREQAASHGKALADMAANMFNRWLDQAGF